MNPFPVGSNASYLDYIGPIPVSYLINAVGNSPTFFVTSTQQSGIQSIKQLSVPSLTGIGRYGSIAEGLIVELSGKDAYLRPYFDANPVNVMISDANRKMFLGFDLANGTWTNVFQTPMVPTTRQTVPMMSNQSFFEKYKWWIVVIILIIVLLVVAYSNKNAFKVEL